MKQFILNFCIMFILMSCGHDAPSFQLQDEPELATRALVTSVDESVSNPNLISDWENVETVVLNTSGSERRATLPWVTKGGSSTLVADSICMDIKKKDGWVMLFHTFKQQGLDEGQNYICFYNLFTGYLKFFYYVDSQVNATDLQWALKFPDDYNPSVKSSVLAVDTVLSSPANHIIVETPTLWLANNTTLGDVNLSNGWNVFQYKVARYESMPSNTRIQIGANTRLIGNFKFDGITKSDMNGTVTSVISSDKSILNSVATIGGEAAAKLINSKLSSISDKKIAGIDINGILSNISSKENYTKAIKAGLKLLFGQSMTTNLYSTSDIKIAQEGTIQLEGTSWTPMNSSIWPLTVNLSYVLNPVSFVRPYPEISLASSFGSIVTTPTLQARGMAGLGVWTLKENPKVYYNPITRYYPTLIGQSSSSTGRVDVEGFTLYPEIVDYDLEVDFNPYITPYITSYDVDVDFVECDLWSEEEGYMPKISLFNNPKLTNHIYAKIPHCARMVMHSGVHKIDRNESTVYYVNWGENMSFKTVAMVTVTMNINYLGNTMQVTETRAYGTDSYVDETLLDGNSYHRPPISILMNNADSRIISCTCESSVPPFVQE